MFYGGVNHANRILEFFEHYLPGADAKSTVASVKQPATVGEFTVVQQWKEDANRTNKTFPVPRAGDRAGGGVFPARPCPIGD